MSQQVQQQDGAFGTPDMMQFPLEAWIDPDNIGMDPFTWYVDQGPTEMPPPGF